MTLFCHPRVNGDPATRVCGLDKLYARYRSHWIPAFAGMTFLACLLFALPVTAAQQCYSPEEAEAEQLLRLHSELMVITVTCHQGSRGENLVPAYTTFTQEHLPALHNAEQTLIAYYHRTFGGKGIDELDRLRTRLGNEYGQKIAKLSAPIFCQLYRDRVLQMCGVGTEDIKTETDKLALECKTYVKTCPPLAKSK